MQKILSALFGISLFAGSAATALAADLNLAWVGAKDSTALTGVEQGVKEANLQGRFLGYEAKLHHYSNAKGLKDAKVVAVMTDLVGDELEQVLLAKAGVPVFYVGNQDHSLMPPQCKANLLTVLPPQMFLQDAAAAWVEAKPDKPKGDAMAWHPDFVKFAARDLNKRYKAAFGQSMGSEAWAGWVSVKAIVGAYAGGADNGDATVLLFADPGQRGRFSFDGQKGTNMSFRQDGILPQVVLIATSEKLLGEAPGLWPKDGQMSVCSGH